jgi:hypothetical protein
MALFLTRPLDSIEVLYVRTRGVELVSVVEAEHYAKRVALLGDFPRGALSTDLAACGC